MLKLCIVLLKIVSVIDYYLNAKTGRTDRTAGRNFHPCNEEESLSNFDTH